MKWHIERESVRGARLTTPTRKSSSIGKILVGGTRIAFEEIEEKEEKEEDEQNGGPGRVRWFRMELGSE